MEKKNKIEELTREKRAWTARTYSKKCFKGLNRGCGPEAKLQTKIGRSVGDEIKRGGSPNESFNGTRLFTPPLFDKPEKAVV